jgi:hypothetical protein
MNYFGHASVAVLAGGSPGFVLGSMLPDLAAMAGLRVTLVDQAEIQAGLDFHVRTDAVFHQSQEFIEWNRRALADLSTLGIRRGPARACAHIGVEMLIDALLVDNAEFRDGYFSALCYGQEVTVLLGPEENSASGALRGLCGHLEHLGIGVFGASHQRFHERLGRTLAGRARLAPTEQELTKIAGYLSQQDFVKPSLPSLLQRLKPLFEEL